MKQLVFIGALITLAVSAALAQQKTNDEIAREIKRLGVSKIDVTYDAASKTSKIMGVSENFSNSETGGAGILAMNFAIGFFYPGQTLTAPPQSVHFTFWVMTRKPRFAENHHFTAVVDGRSIDLGDGRYAAKPNQNMEYLNFDIPLSDLAAIASAKSVKFGLGRFSFTPTESQIQTIAAMVKAVN
jgi:hypothetical protein